METRWSPREVSVIQEMPRGPAGERRFLEGRNIALIVPVKCEDLRIRYQASFWFPDVFVSVQSWIYDTEAEAVSCAKECLDVRGDPDAEVQ